MVFHSRVFCYKFQHLGSGRKWEWIFLAEIQWVAGGPVERRIGFLRRTRGGHIAFDSPPYGTWFAANDQISLRNFRCTEGARYRNDDLTLLPGTVSWIKYQVFLLTHPVGDYNILDLITWHDETWEDIKQQHDMKWHEMTMTWNDMTWNDMRWHEVTWLEINHMKLNEHQWTYMTWHDMTWHDMTWHDMTWHDMTWHDMTWHDMTWHDMTWDMTWQDITWHDKTWHDVTWHDMNWHDVLGN